MQFSIATIVTILTAATAVSAYPSDNGAHLFKRANCDSAYNYCGSSLMKKGAYMDQILAAIKAAGKSGESTKYKSMLFDCVGGKNGDIKYIKTCSKGCLDNGADRSDACKP